MTKGIVLECPECGNQRPFGIDPDNPPELIEPKLKLSASRHLEKTHGQDEMKASQWLEITETMFEADIPQDLLNKLDDNNYQGPVWEDYGLR